DDDVKIDLSTDLSRAVKILRRLQIARVDVLHTIGLESRIVPLLHTLDVPFDVTFLDYYLLSTQPHLGDSNGRFVGDDKLNQDGSPLRETPSPILREAARILACSRDVAARIQQIAPALHAVPVRLPEPHRPAQYRVSSRPAAPDGSFHVLLMGAVSAHKGL